MGSCADRAEKPIPLTGHCRPASSGQFTAKRRASVAYEHRRPGDQHEHILLIPSAEAAIQAGSGRIGTRHQGRPFGHLLQRGQPEIRRSLASSGHAQNVQQQYGTLWVSPSASVISVVGQGISDQSFRKIVTERNRWLVLRLIPISASLHHVSFRYMGSVISSHTRCVPALQRVRALTTQLRRTIVVP